MSRWLAVGLLLCGTTLEAQGLLLLERRFSADSVGSSYSTVTLQRNVVYRAELIGSGTLSIEPVNRSDRPAFIVPIDTLNPTVRRFEVYAVLAGPHRVGITEIPAGETTQLRFYQDSSESRHIAEKRGRALALGVLLSAGSHEGYRLDATTPANPSAALTTQGCLVLQTGSRFATCLGAGGDRLPESGYSVLWLFIEERVRLVTAKVIGVRPTDLGGSLRVSQAFDAGPHGLDPSLISWGLFVSQALGAADTRRGLRLVAGWQRNAIGNLSGAEPSHYDSFNAGVIWIP